MASLTQFDVYGSQKVELTMSEACAKMKIKHTPLVEAVTVNEIDCMGTKFKTLDICLKDFAKDSNFIRGYVDRESKKVICEKANKVILKYSCAPKEELCIDSEIACFDLKKKLVYALKLYRHFFSDEGTKKILTCIFDS